MDKREEIAAWTKSLKPGDKVILQSGWCYNDLSVLEVAKVTPAGWVKTTNNVTFSPRYGSMYARGRDIGRIVQVTDELLQKAQKQDAERAEANRKRYIIVKARNILHEEYMKSNKMTYEKAVKIIEVFEAFNGMESVK